MINDNLNTKNNALNNILETNQNLPCYTCKSKNKGIWSTIFQSTMFIWGVISLLGTISSLVKPQDDRFELVLDKMAEESAEVGRLKAIIKDWGKKASEEEEKK